jgi:hypothetical protein
VTDRRRALDVAADDPTLVSEALVLLDAIDCGADALEGVIARVARSGPSGVEKPGCSTA